MSTNFEKQWLKKKAVKLVCLACGSQYGFGDIEGDEPLCGDCTPGDISVEVARSKAFKKNPQFLAFAKWLAWWLGRKGWWMGSKGGDAWFTVPHLMAQSSEWQYDGFAWGEKIAGVSAYKISRRTLYRYIGMLGQYNDGLRLLRVRKGANPYSGYRWDDAGLMAYFEGKL
ncbi:MAG: hypothetical protein ABFS03_04020 [Chloroflexota bacterium]